MLKNDKELLEQYYRSERIEPQRELMQLRIRFDERRGQRPERKS